MTEQDACVDSPTNSLLGNLEISISVLGLILNGIAIFIIIALRDFKKSISHWYVLQLAIADSVFLALLALMGHQHLKGSWEFPDWTCNAFKSFFMTNYYAGILFLTVMSFDRYVAIVHPVSSFWRKLRTHGNAVMITAIVWVFSILMGIPIWMWSAKTCTCEYRFPASSEEFGDHHGGQMYDSEENYHYDDVIVDYSEDEQSLSDGNQSEYGENDTWSGMNTREERGGAIQMAACRNPPWRAYNAWLICSFIFTFLLPVIVMGICYSLILWRVLHPSVSSANKSTGRRKSYQAQSSDRRYSILKSFRSSLRSTFSRSSTRNTSQKQKVTIIVILLVATFFVCWFPFYFVQLMKFHGIEFMGADCTTTQHVVNVLAYVNSMLNPVFYTFLGSKFYQRLHAAIRSIQRRGSHRSSAFIKYTRSSRTGAPAHGRASAIVAVNKGTKPSSTCHVNTNHSSMSKSHPLAHHGNSIH